MIRERKRGSCASSQEAKKESTAKDKIQQGLAAQAKLQQHRRERRTVLAGWEEQKDSTIEVFSGVLTLFWPQRWVFCTPHRNVCTPAVDDELHIPTMLLLGLRLASLNKP